MTIRVATEADQQLLLGAAQWEPVRMIGADTFLRELELGQYRWEWSWIAVEQSPAGGERLVARALWWGLAGAEHPVSLDDVWVDRAQHSDEATGVAAELIAAGQHALLAAGTRQLPELNLMLKQGWKTDPAAVSAVAWRQDAAARAGLTQVIERLSYAWTTEHPRPPRSTRLQFTAADDDAFVTAFRAVAVGSLDLLTLQNVAELGAEGAARDDLEFYLSLPSERGLWRIAHDASGALVGFIIPSRSAYDASVSYLGVLPEQRGTHYVDDLLAEITHVHADNGADKITGTTDTTNAPMAAAFLRAGYEVTEARLVISAPAS